MRVAVTCLQLIRDLDGYRDAMTTAGLDVVVPEVPGQHLEGRALVDGLAGCVGVVAGDDQYTAEVLAELPDLRVISKWGIGIDGIDREAAAARGITVTNTPGAFNDEVADVSMGYVIALCRDLVRIDREVRAGRWHKPPGRSLRGMTLGIIALGGIGRALIPRALASGMEVIGFDPTPESQAAARELGAEIVELDELLSRSEVISVNAPLTPATHHLLDDRAFGLVSPGTLLVNTGRGGVVDTAALVRALDAGTIAATAVDVLEEEPPGPDHPLRSFEQVVFGSHNASNTMEASARVHVMAIRNLAASLDLELEL
ncbi:MAG: phosphoglycerate dehydrogenase [Actinomycetota bacterium]